MSRVAFRRCLASALLAVACSNAPAPGTTPGSYTFCEAMNAATSECGSPSSLDACSQAAIQQCATLEGGFSEGFQAFVVSCAKRFAPCSLAFVNCIDAPSLSPSSVDSQLEAAFCAWCPDNPAYLAGPCSTFFDDVQPDGGLAVTTGSGGTTFVYGPGSTSPLSIQAVYGLGYQALDVDDAVAARMENCIGDAGAEDAGLPCDVAFYACAQSIRYAATTPSVCQGDGGP